MFISNKYIKDTTNDFIYELQGYSNKAAWTPDDKVNEIFRRLTDSIVYWVVCCVLDLFTFGHYSASIKQDIQFYMGDITMKQGRQVDAAAACPNDKSLIEMAAGALSQAGYTPSQLASEVLSCLRVSRPDITRAQIEAVLKNNR